jgi:hypothetical protein
MWRVPSASRPSGQGAVSREQITLLIAHCLERRAWLRRYVARGYAGTARGAAPVRRAGLRRYGVRGGGLDTPVGVGRCHPVGVGRCHPWEWPACVQ